MVEWHLQYSISDRPRLPSQWVPLPGNIKSWQTRKKPQGSQTRSVEEKLRSPGRRGFWGHMEHFSPCSIFCSRAPPSFADGFVCVGGPGVVQSRGWDHTAWILPPPPCPLTCQIDGKLWDFLHSSVLTGEMGELQEYPFTWLSGRLRGGAGRHLGPCLAQASPFTGYYPCYISQFNAR